MKQWTVLLALVFIATPAMAQDTNATVPDVQNATADNPFDSFLNGVGDAVSGVGTAVEETGEGIGEGVSAVGGAITAAMQAIGKGAIAATKAVAATGALVAAGLVIALAGLGPALAGLGDLSTSGIAGVGNGLLWTVLALGDGLLAYTGLVDSLRPAMMPPAAYTAVTATAAAGSAGAGGWAGFQALRKWGWVGSGLGGVAGFSRIQDGQLLEHPLRSDIFDTIKTHPGIHASQLARELDVGWGTITHHLDKLTRAKMVTTRRVNNQKCFFEQGGEISRQDMQIASALKGDTASSIAAFVQSHPMTSQKNMAEALGISPALASFHVKKLTNMGVLDKVRHGKETLLATSDGLRRIMASEDPVAAAVLQKEEAGFDYSS